MHESTAYFRPTHQTEKLGRDVTYKYTVRGEDNSSNLQEDLNKMTVGQS